MKRKMTLFTSLLLLVSLCFTGLFVVNASSDITVLMPRHEMDLIGIWEKQTREFEMETGISVEFIQMSWDEVADKVLIDLASGGGTFDVIEFDNGWVAKFGNSGWLEPLNEIASEQYVNDLLPGLVSAFTNDGQLYGIPWNNDTRFFFYNKEMLKKAGITAPPKTWEEVVEQSKILKEKGICEYPIAEYWNQEWALANSIAFYLYSFGGDYIENSEVTINKSPSLDAITFMVDMLIKEELVNPSSVTLSQEAAADLFYRGSSAFFFQGPASMFNYANDPKKSQVVGDVEVASWLPGKTSSLQATLTLPEAFAIPKSSKNKDLAWKYIQFMISKKKDKERAEAIGSLPLFKDLYNDKGLLEKYPYWEQFGEQSDVAKALPQVAWYDELVQETIVDVQGALLGYITPQEATNKIANFIEKIK